MPKLLPEYLEVSQSAARDQMSDDQLSPNDNSAQTND